MIGLACVFFLLAATPTVVAAPWGVTALMLLVWVAALVQGCRWFVRRPRARCSPGQARRQEGNQEGNQESRQA